jgi:hypothetical protein
MNTKLASYLDTIKEQAYKDEIDKIADGKNYVAKYGLKGSSMGAGVGSLSSLAIASHVLKNMNSKAKNPIIVAAMTAGAVAGATVGGNIGAYMGGAKKATKQLDFVEGKR